MGHNPNPGTWRPEDTVLAVEWQRLKDDTCPGCGQIMHESLDPKNEERYETSVITCHGCATREIEAKKITDRDDSRPFGKRVLVHLSPAPEEN